MSQAEQRSLRVTAAVTAGRGGRRLREIGRRAMWRFAPAYGRRRKRSAEDAASLRRLQDELDRLNKRHGEQIERLEDMVRELVLSAESLRREIERRDSGDPG